MASNMFLFWGSGSAPCWKAMLALEEKGFSGYPNKLLSFHNKEHKSPEVTALNPRGQLPTFKDGDIIICESQAICEYLELAYPEQGTRLLPRDKKELAVAVQRMNEATNVHKTVIEGVFIYKTRTKPENFDEEVHVEKRIAATKELDLWENYLKTAGPGGFVAGKNFTMADIMFFPFLAFAVRLGLSLTSRPNMADYYTRMSNRKSVQASWPPHWRESEGDKTVFHGI